MNLTPSKRRWLVVDDNPHVLDVAARMLRAAGRAEVVAFERPEDALEALSADPNSFEFLLTDFDMPGMDGIELARTVTAKASHLRVMLMTGSHLNEVQLLRPEVQLVLPKPFTREVLLSSVDALLGENGTVTHDLAETKSLACSS